MIKGRRGRSQEQQEASLKKELYRHYKRTRADIRSLLFTLTLEEFTKLISLPCYYCGRPPSNIFKAHSYENRLIAYQGIDREDNTVGYTRSNSVPCCFECNKLKGTRSHIEFLSYIVKIYKYSIEDVRRDGHSL